MNDPRTHLQIPFDTTVAPRREWPIVMKKIKLTGREQAVLKAIDFSTGTPGSEVLLRTHLEVLELVEILNSLIDAGFVECSPVAEHVTPESLP